ncbi:MAG: hypothetical protein NTZ09_14255, partial [Candidatus Hydrogenedentes bacterium]|nr:hypothetical protein [Candidatus Hydrogenedentota bacterium]
YISSPNRNLEISAGAAAKNGTPPTKAGGASQTALLYELLELPAYGFYCRHARNVSFNDIEVGFEKADGRPALVCDDVEQLEVTHLVAAAANPEPGVLWFTDTRDARVTECRTTGRARKFLRLDGAGTGKIVAHGNKIEARGHAAKN